jgi:hypothetical protein
MSAARKIFERVLSGNADHALRFSELCALLRRLGFDERVRGSHHIFSRDGVEEILNLQPLPAGGAKPYQVRQVRKVLLRYALGGALDE